MGGDCAHIREFGARAGHKIEVHRNQIFAVDANVVCGRKRVESGRDAALDRVFNRHDSPKGLLADHQIDCLLNVRNGHPELTLGLWHLGER